MDLDPGTEAKLAKARELQAKSNTQYQANKPEEKPVIKTLPFFDIDDLEALPPTSWIIERIIPKKGLISLFGACSSYKTFITLDICLCIAMGIDYFGTVVAQGTVLYILAEGEGDITDRVKAWCIGKGVSYANLKNKIFFITQPAPLNQEGMLENVLATIAKIKEERGVDIRVISVDTVNRNMVGDENATKDMTSFVQACAMLQVHTGAAVILVHHSGYSNATRARGSSVLVSAVDSEITVVRDVSKGNSKRKLDSSSKPRGDTTKMWVSKLRCGKDGLEHHFEAVWVKIPPDEERESVYLVENKQAVVEESSEEDDIPLTKYEQLLFFIYQMEEKPSNPGVIEMPDRSRQTVYRQVNALKKDGMLTKDLVLTEKAYARLLELDLITEDEAG